MNEQRLIDLEIKFSHQDYLIEELRQTVHEQYLVINKLEKTLKAITDRLELADIDIKTNHEKPPHY